MYQSSYGLFLKGPNVKLRKINFVVMQFDECELNIRWNDDKSH